MVFESSLAECCTDGNCSPYPGTALRLRPCFWRAYGRSCVNSAYDRALAGGIRRDPLGEVGGINLYQFAGNEPTDVIDDFGHRSMSGTTSLRGSPGFYGRPGYTRPGGVPIHVIRPPPRPRRQRPPVPPRCQIIIPIPHFTEANVETLHRAEAMKEFIDKLLHGGGSLDYPLPSPPPSYGGTWIGPLPEPQPPPAPPNVAPPGWTWPPVNNIPDIGIIGIRK